MDKLMEIKALLLNSTSDAIISNLEYLDIGKLFEQIHSIDRFRDDDYLGEVLSVISLVLDSIPCEYIFTKFTGQIRSGLLSKKSEIQEVWIKTLDKCLCDQDSFDMFLCDDSHSFEMILIILNLIGSENISVSKHAISIIAKMGKTSYSKIIFSKVFLDKLIEIKERNNIVRLRILELMVILASHSEENLERIEKEGFLIEVVSNVTNEDLLVGLNAIQILSTFAKSNLGANYLHEKGCLNWMQDKILSFSEDDSTMEMYITYYMGIFASIGKRSLKILKENYTPFLRKLLHYCAKDKSVTLTIHSISLFSHIGESLEGKKFLNEFENFTSTWVAKIWEMTENVCHVKKVEALNSLGRLLAINELDPNGEGEAITETWFHAGNQTNTLSFLIHLASQPFAEIRLASLKLMRVFSTHLWGVKALSKEPKFFKYLMDRSNGVDKEGKEGKFDIVKELIQSPFSQSTFSREQMNLISKYYKEGPFYVDRENAVMMGSDS